jgi:hypothetical protein
MSTYFFWGGPHPRADDLVLVELALIPKVIDDKQTLWMTTPVAPHASPLDQDERCDVTVIGSGIAGLSTAYELSELGRSVIVVDRSMIAGGMTARTSAHLAPLCDDLMSEMQKIKGADLAKLFYESQAAAVDRIGEIQKNESIDCDFRRRTVIFFRATKCRLT